MREEWTLDKIPDKRDVISVCPSCDKETHPLMIPLTVELSHEREKNIKKFIKRTDTITYGVVCNKCKEKYKIELIIYSFHYAKLGRY